MRVELLGRLRVSDGGVPIEVTQARRRALLAVLALADGGWLTVDRVVDALWGDDVPASAVQSVRVWVSELRKLLGSEAIETEGASYRLTIGSDVGEARRALDRARIAHDAGDHRTAFDAYSAALVEWRGPALADFRYDEFAQPAIRALDGARLDAEIGRLEAALMAGDEGRRLVADAEALLAEHPHHERLHAALMVALYRDGRQVDALEVAARYRDRLRVELGVEPGPRVRDMELAILRQDGSVAGPAAPSTGSIPAPAGPLFGREGEVSGLLGALRSARLVSIVGFGGIGKTRLALEVARRARDRFAHGAWFVGLADAAPGNVERVVTEALVGTTASEDPAGWLGRRRLLLVLDNCEHVIEEVRELLTRLLPAAEGLRVLTTTRRPLDLPDEVTFELGPLTPEAGIEMLRSLASMRSTGSPSDPSTVARAADLASGIPLGIVLLAPHLGSGRVPSAPVMQGAFAASYALLGESARTALLGVSVFRGGWDEEAFRAVAGLESDALRELREHAWVDLDTDRRYSMLPPVREFADSLLDERGRDDLAERHATYYLGLARRGYAGISRWGVEASWHARLAMEADNLNRAMDWALEHDGDIAIGLGASLTRFWARVRRRPGLEDRLADIARVSEGGGGRDAVVLLAHLSHEAFRSGERDVARLRAERALAIAEQVGETGLVGWAQHRLATAYAADRFGYFSLVSTDGPDKARGIALAEAAVDRIREAGDEGNLIGALYNLGGYLATSGRGLDALEVSASLLEMAAEVDSPIAAAFGWTIEAHAAGMLGRFRLAATAVGRAVSGVESMGLRRFLPALLVIHALLAADDPPAGLESTLRSGLGAQADVSLRLAALAQLVVGRDPEEGAAIARRAAVVAVSERSVQALDISAATLARDSDIESWAGLASAVIAAHGGSRGAILDLVWGRVPLQSSDGARPDFTGGRAGVDWLRVRRAVDELLASSGAGGAGYFFDDS